MRHLLGFYWVFLIFAYNVHSTSSNEETNPSSSPESRSSIITRLAFNLSGDCANSTLSQNAPQTVSAASALWGIIALAINAMTQRSGADRFPSSDALSPARSSPFICLADMLVSLLWLTHGLKQGLGVGRSFHWYRREMGLIREATDRQLIQGIPVVTIFFFILGPLPQAIKILGSGGLYGTKAWVSIFFAAWLLDAIVRLLASLPASTTEETDNPSSKSLADYLRKVSVMIFQVAFMLQIIVWLWILMFGPAHESMRFISGFIALILVWSGTGGLWLSAVIISFKNASSGRSKIRTFLFTTIWALWLSGPLLLMSVKSRFIAVILSSSRLVGYVCQIVIFLLVVYVFVWIMTALLVGIDFVISRAGQGVVSEAASGSMSTYNREETRLFPSHSSTSVREDESRLWETSDHFSNTISEAIYRFSFYSKHLPVDQNRRALAIAFALTNLCATSIYYGSQYNPSGTVKPTWTELLG